MARFRRAPIGAAAALLALGLTLGGGLAGCATNFLGGHGQGAQNQKRQAPGPNQPTGTIDPRDQNAAPAPPRTAPIQGQAPNPFGTAPQGALPDPYANPPR